MEQRRPPQPPLPGRPARAPRPFNDSMFSMLKRQRGPPAKWSRPALLAFLVGLVLQLGLGIFPSMLSFMLLLGADETRCPVALGAASSRPFIAWMLGVFVGIYLCEMVSSHLHKTRLLSWVIWGAICEVWPNLKYGAGPNAEKYG